MKTYLLLFLAINFLKPTEWLVFTDPLNQFSISYPSDWQKKSIDKTQSIFVCQAPKDSPFDKFQENVNVFEGVSDPKIKIDDYSKNLQNDIIKSFGSQSILSIKETKIAGQNARECIYSFKYGDFNLKVKQYWFIKGNKTFIITYTGEVASFLAFEPIANEMIKSFKFLG